MAARGLRSPILADLIGGISLTGLMIPESIAYSAIAGLPPSFGAIAAVVGPLAYAIVGRSRLAVVTATSGAAALLAAAIGLFFLLGAAFRLASLTNFISRAVLHGFSLGLAITITIRQLPALFGLPVTQNAPLQILGSVIAHATDIHWPSALLGGAALLFLGLASRLRFMAAGLVVTLTAIIAMHFGPTGHFGIAIAGPLSFELAAPHVPSMAAKDWGRLAQLALPIALVILAESWATIRSLAAMRGDVVTAEREIAALGLANLASALLFEPLNALRLITSLKLPFRPIC